MRQIHNYYTKLFLIVLITVIISTGLITGISTVSNINNIRSITEHSLISSAEQKAKIFEVNIRSLHALSKSIGDDVEVRDYFMKLRSGKEETEFYQTLKMDLEEEMKSYSGLLENAFFVYDGLVYLDSMGGESVGFDIEGEDSEWYTYVKKNKTQYLGKLKKSPITGLPVMVSVYPILDDNNQILAVFGFAINLNGFSSAVISNSEESNESTMIIDEDGTVVSANETELIYNYNLSKELPKLFGYIEKNKEGVTYYQRNGINYIASVKRAELGVTIVQSLPVSVYYNPIIVTIVIAIIILLIILGCVAIITYIIAKNITKPIHILVEEFDDMAKGNYDKEIPDYIKRRKDEFGQLGNALTLMKSETNFLITNLNISNEEIEASLEEVLATKEELRNQNELLTESEIQLKKSNDYNQAIIKVLPDLIFILDREGTFTDCQASKDNMLLMPKELFLGRNLKDIMPYEVAKEGYEKIQEALNTGTLQSFEYELDIEGNIEIFELRIVRCFADGVMAIARNITSQRLYQKQIEYLSYHDQLTDLHNRRFFEEELKQLDIETNLPLCIIMADVNGLKLVNDSFGHKIGDELLVKFAEVLKASCTTENVISRIGGDEFVILLPKTNHDKAEGLIKTIKYNCDRETVEAINLSVSFGWEVKNQLDEDINEVLKSAEDFMYKKKLFEGPSMRGKTISAIINTLHEKNKREEQHSRRVAELCQKLAVALKMPDREIEEIKSAGLLHDIGKVAIQEELLNKPGRLTREEFEEISRHPEIGYRILCSVNDMNDIAEFVLSHHERWDGKGYPRGLSGEKIPLQARMISIVDAFDAMTSVRSYRLSVSEEDAAREILKCAGTQFDPDLSYQFVHEVLEFHFDE